MLFDLLAYLDLDINVDCHICVAVPNKTFLLPKMFACYIFFFIDISAFSLYMFYKTFYSALIVMQDGYKSLNLHDSIE